MIKEHSNTGAEVETCTSRGPVDFFHIFEATEITGPFFEIKYFISYTLRIPETIAPRLR